MRIYDRDFRYLLLNLVPQHRLSARPPARRRSCAPGRGAEALRREACGRSRSCARRRTSSGPGCGRRTVRRRRVPPKGWELSVQRRPPAREREAWVLPARRRLLRRPTPVETPAPFRPRAARRARIGRGAGPRRYSPTSCARSRCRPRDARIGTPRSAAGRARTLARVRGVTLDVRKKSWSPAATRARVQVVSDADLRAYDRSHAPSNRAPTS